MATAAAEHKAPRKGIMHWLTTVDHKELGLLYLGFALINLFIGGAMAWAMRAELALPGYQLMDGAFFNQMTAMHASVMIFMVIIPAFTGFANYFAPIMIGSPDMAFPRLNNWGFWILPVAECLAIASMFVPGGSITAGWTAYPPLSNSLYSPGAGVDLWIFTVHLAGASSIMGAVNFITTILNMRCPGMTMFRMPLFMVSGEVKSRPLSVQRLWISVCSSVIRW